MAQITIGSSTYDGYCDVAYADNYMAADASLHSRWAALDDNAKGRAIVSATRAFKALCWEAGDPPDVASGGDIVLEACAIMAAMVAAEPGLISGGAGAVNGQSGGQDVKRAKAGSAEVEFFDPLRTPDSRQSVEYGSAQALPDRVRALLDGADLLCQSSSRLKPYNAGRNAERCPGSCENGFSGPLS